MPKFLLAGQIKYRSRLWLYTQANCPINRVRDRNSGDETAWGTMEEKGIKNNPKGPISVIGAFLVEKFTNFQPCALTLSCFGGHAHKKVNFSLAFAGAASGDKLIEQPPEFKGYVTVGFDMK